MSDKNVNEEKKEVVKVSVKKVVNTTKDKNEEVDSQKTMEEHMTENKKNTKIAIDWKNLFTYFLLFILLGTTTYFVVRFIDKYNADVESKKTTTTMPTFTTTTRTKPSVSYELTTEKPTKATHTVFDKNR